MSDHSSPATTPRNNAITAVAVANFVLGGLRIALTLLAIWYLFDVLLSGLGEDPDLLKLVGLIALVIMWPLLLAMAIISIVAGIVLILAGMAMLRRSRWSRTVTLVLGGLGGALAAIYGMQLWDQMMDGEATMGVAISIAGMLVHGGYCVLVFVVLLNPRNAAEFS
jgi:hypothetical protein